MIIYGGDNHNPNQRELKRRRKQSIKHNILHMFNVIAAIRERKVAGSKTEKPGTGGKERERENLWLWCEINLPCLPKISPAEWLRERMLMMGKMERAFEVSSRPSWLYFPRREWRRLITSSYTESPIIVIHTEAKKYILSPKRLIRLFYDWLPFPLHQHMWKWGSRYCICYLWQLRLMTDHLGQNSLHSYCHCKWNCSSCAWEQS